MSAPAKQRLIHAYVVLGLAAAILYGAAWCFSASQKKLEAWNRAPGLVVEMERKPLSRNSRKHRWYAHVRFEAEGGEAYTFRSRESTRVVRCDVGDRIEVLYPAGNPSDACIYTFWSSYRWTIALALVGLNMAAFGGAMLFFARPDDPRVKAVKAWFREG